MSGQIPEYTGRNWGVLGAGADRTAISVGARMHQRDHGLKDVHHRNPAPRRGKPPRMRAARRFASPFPFHRFFVTCVVSCF